MYRTDIAIGECLSEGFELFKKDAGLLILCGLVTTLISSLTGGILGGPLYAGMLMVCLALHDKVEPKPQVGDVFRGFDLFLQTFLFGLVWMLILGVGAFILVMVASLFAFLPLIGWLVAPLLQLALIIAACVAPAFLMFGLFFIFVDQMEFWPASMRSIELVRQNPLPFVGLFAVIALIGVVGTAVCCVGMIVTTPIQFAIITATYRRVFPEENHFEQKLSTPPPPPPPDMNPTDFT